MERDSALRWVAYPHGATHHEDGVDALDFRHVRGHGQVAHVPHDAHEALHRELADLLRLEAQQGLLDGARRELDQVHLQTD